MGVEAAFLEHYPAVLRQVQRLMQNGEDAQDLTQTAWEKAQRAWERRPAADVEVRPWLFRIARNACVDELRRRKLVRWESLDMTGPVGLEEDARPSLAAQLKSDLCEPERETLRDEQRAQVRMALDRLPARYRVCLLLREAEGLSCEEIGQQLQLSAGAVRTTLCRARQRLKQEYLAVGGDPTVV